MGKRTGIVVESSRGYVIRAWAPTGAGEKPYSFGPAQGFDKTWFDTKDAAIAALLAAPPLREVRVEFAFYLPPGVEVTEEQIGEFVEFELHYNGSCSGDNPLNSHQFEAHDVIVRDVRDVR